MADNSVNLAAPTGTAAADDIAGVLYQRIKVGWGTDGTWNETDTATGKPVPIQLRGSDGTDRSNLLPVSISSIAAGTTNIGDVDVLSLIPGSGATNLGKDINGTAGASDTGVAPLAVRDDVLSTLTPVDGKWVPFRTNSLGQLHVASTIYTSGGTEASAITTVAHGVTDAGDPLKIGFKTTASLSAATPVTAGQRSDGFAGTDGVQITRPHCNLEDIIDPLPVAITGGTSTAIVASAGAGIRNYITSVIIANTSATAVTVDIRNGTAGAVKATFPVPASTSGVVCNLPVPLRFDAATAVAAHPSASATSIIVTLLGFKSKV